MSSIANKLPFPVLIIYSPSSSLSYVTTDGDTSSSFTYVPVAGTKLSLR